MNTYNEITKAYNEYITNSISKDEFQLKCELLGISYHRLINLQTLNINLSYYNSSIKELIIKMLENTQYSNDLEDYVAFHSGALTNGNKVFNKESLFNIFETIVRSDEHAFYNQACFILDNYLINVNPIHLFLIIEVSLFEGINIIDYSNFQLTFDKYISYISKIMLIKLHIEYYCTYHKQFHFTSKFVDNNTKILALFLSIDINEIKSLFQYMPSNNVDYYLRKIKHIMSKVRNNDKINDLIKSITNQKDFKKFIYDDY